LKRTILILSFILVYIFSLAGKVPAQNTVFTGKGSAVVVGNDKLGAVKLAYQAALKKSVSKAMKSLIQKGTKDEVNFNLKKAELLQGPFDFITEEDQISNTMNGQLLTIMLRIKIDRNKLSRYLGQKGVLATRSKKKKQREFPSVMILITEELNGQINYSPYSSAVVNQALLDKNFEVVDENVVQKSIKHDQAVQALLNNDPRAAQALALQYSSGMLVTGRAVAQQSAIESGGLQAYGANVTLKFIKADTGRVMATASADGSYPHINMMTGSRKAVEEAAKKAVADLIKKIEKGFETTSESVEVTLSNITFPQLAILKKILIRDFEDISSINQKSFIGQIAKLDIRTDSSATSLSEKIALKDFGTFKLNVLSYSPGKIDLKLKMKQR